MNAVFVNVIKTRIDLARLTLIAILNQRQGCEATPNTTRTATCLYFRVVECGTSWIFPPRSFLSSSSRCYYDNSLLALSCDKAKCKAESRSNLELEGEITQCR